MLDFARAHPLTDASWDPVVSRLEARLTQANALAISERDGRLGARAAVARRTALRDRIHFEMLRHLVYTAQVVGRDVAGFAEKFVLPRKGGPTKTYLTAARQMLAEALPHRDALVAAGLGEKLLDGLGQALDEFEAAATLVYQGRRAHVSARTGLEDAAAALTELVTLLDGLNRPRFASDPALLTAWESARYLDGPDVLNPETSAAPAPIPPIGAEATAPDSPPQERAA